MKNNLNCRYSMHKLYYKLYISHILHIYIFFYILSHILYFHSHIFILSTPINYLDPRHELRYELHLPRTETEAGGGKDRGVCPLRVSGLLRIVMCLLLLLYLSKARSSFFLSIFFLISISSYRLKLVARFFH